MGLGCVDKLQAQSTTLRCRAYLNDPRGPFGLKSAEPTVI